MKVKAARLRKYAFFGPESLSDTDIISIYIDISSVYIDIDSTKTLHVIGSQKVTLNLKLRLIITAGDLSTLIICS